MKNGITNPELTGWPAIDGEPTLLRDPHPDALEPFFQDCGRPFVIRGGPALLGAAVQWSLPYLHETIGGRTSLVFVSADGRFSGGRGPFDPQWQRVCLMNVGEVLDRMAGRAREPIISAGERYYLYQTSAKWWPELMPQIADPVYVPKLGPDHVDRFLWIGSAGNVTLAHFDQADNMLLQVRGRKQVLLWDRRQLPNLYMVPQEEPLCRSSRVPMDTPNPKGFPLFSEARALAWTLEPGDLLYIPMGWIHYVRSLDFAVSVNYWWDLADPDVALEKDNLTDALSHRCAACPSWRFGPTFCRCFVKATHAPLGVGATGSQN
jgi:hypothetical protein